VVYQQRPPRSSTLTMAALRDTLASPSACHPPPRSPEEPLVLVIGVSGSSRSGKGVLCQSLATHFEQRVSDMSITQI
jgi:hypothetical protein